MLYQSQKLQNNLDLVFVFYLLIYVLLFMYVLRWPVDSVGVYGDSIVVIYIVFEHTS